jgi:HAE1 family hydrophobic/amphiphilic exporter-1
VDLLPDIARPTITVRETYLGVGPLEMEELITRPLEQQLSAVAGLEQITSTSDEGISDIRMNFTWGQDLNEAMNEIRSRIDRVRARLPEDADPPIIYKFDSNAFPIMGMAVESIDGSLDRVRVARAGRERAVTAYGTRSGSGGRDRGGRRAPAGSRRVVEGEDHRPRPLGRSRRRVLKTENQNIPLGEVYRATSHIFSAARASSRAWTRSGSWSS